MSDDDKILLFVMGTMERLRSAGQVAGGYHLTAQGLRDYEALVATGFRPQPSQVAGAVKYLQGDPTKP